MTKLPWLALAVRGIRGLAAGARRLPDPLSAAWRVASNRAAFLGALAAVATLLISALALPDLYVRSEDALGLPLAQWPRACVRLLALVRLGSTSWGKLILGVFAAFAAARSSAYLELALAHGDQHQDAGRGAVAPQRHLLYFEGAAAAATLRLRLALAPLGYRWHSTPSGALVESGSTGRLALAVANAALASLALVVMVWHATAAGEVVALGPGGAVPLVVLRGVVLRAENPALAGRLTIAAVAGAYNTAVVSARHRRPVLLGDVVLIWEGRGPALLIEPVGSEQEVGSDQPADTDGRLFIAFLPGEQVRYVALPGGQASLRVSLQSIPTASPFTVEFLPADPSGSQEAYTISRPTTLRLGGILLRFGPGEYYVVSLTRAPLIAPSLALLLAAVVAFAAFLAFRRPPLRISLASRGSITAIEIEAFTADPRQVWWLRVVRLALL